MKPAIALTTGEIARRLNVPIHRVDYLIKSRDIHPTERAGHLRIFDTAALNTFRREIEGVTR